MHLYHRTHASCYHTNTPDFSSHKDELYPRSHTLEPMLHVKTVSCPRPFMSVYCTAAAQNLSILGLQLTQQCDFVSFFPITIIIDTVKNKRLSATRVSACGSRTKLHLPAGIAAELAAKPLSPPERAARRPSCQLRTGSHIPLPLSHSS